MNSIKKLCVASVFALAAAAHADKAADRQAVDNACKADAVAAGCGNEVVGKGLLKCIHAFKKEHKEFKLSDSCKAARKQLRSDRKAEKAAQPAVK